MPRRILTFWVGAFLFASGCSTTRAPRFAANDNRTSAGRLENGVFTLSLEAREARWYPDGESGPSLVMQMFAEPGRAPQNPGPMIRVPAGTTIRLTLHNVLHDSALVVYGLHTRPGTTSDSIEIAPGGTREVSFDAGEPGTYFYWGTTTHDPVDRRNGIDSQLQGAFIVDARDAPASSDRVFVLGSWTGPEDKKLGFAPELRVINGLSWPGTERLTYTAGDTILVALGEPDRRSAPDAPARFLLRCLESRQLGSRHRIRSGRSAPRRDRDAAIGPDLPDALGTRGTRELAGALPRGVSHLVLALGQVSARS
jgi:FtsP/CotA-like multicopper oxidase with cupredoxin domain